MRGGGDDAGANGRCQSEHCGGEDRRGTRTESILLSSIHACDAMGARQAPGDREMNRGMVQEEEADYDR